jgi:peptide/nickel transport system substrate-binding protein
MKRLFFVIVAAAILCIPAALATADTQPKSGGTLTMAIETEPPMLDPTFSQSTLVTSLTDLCFDFLWRWDKNFSQFEGHIATSWNWIDPTHFKINLRHGVTFHNGREVKAADVKYSIDRVLDPKVASPSAVFLEPIKEVNVDSDYSLTIVVKYPWFGLMDKLARQVAIVPHEVVEQYGDLKTHPVGSGPFVFESWEPGYEMKFKKFDNYWDKGKPYLDNVVLRFMPEYNTAKNALLSGEIDMINWPDTSDIDSLKANKNLELHYFNVTAIEYVCINTAHKPLNNPLVRKALALSINRDSFNDALYKGLGKVSWTPIPQSQPYFKQAWEYKRDVPKAKQLLAQAGYPNGFSIKIMALRGPEEIMGEVLQSNLADIGVKGVVDVVEIPIALDAIFNKQDFDLGVLGDIVSPDPDLFLSKYMVPEGQDAGATGKWDNATVRELVAKGRGMVNMADRVPNYQRIIDVLEDQVPMIFLVWPIRHPASRTYVKGWFSWGDVRYDWPSVWLDK